MDLQFDNFGLSLPIVVFVRWEVHIQNLLSGSILGIAFLVMNLENLNLILVEALHHCLISFFGIIYGQGTPVSVPNVLGLVWVTLIYNLLWVPLEGN